MFFTVFNRKNCRRFQYAEHDFSSIIITISDPDKDNIIFLKTPENKIKAVLPLKFDDVDIYTAKPTDVIISDEDAKKIVAFVGKYKDSVDNIIVNCEGGVSRSAGCCAAIMLALTGDDSKIFNNPSKCPNMTVYRKVLNAFWDAGYFNREDESLSEITIKSKEEHNIDIWKIANEI